MPAIKVKKTAMPVDPEMVELDKLRGEWTESHRQLDADALSGTCYVPGCRTMPFVMLKTTAGRRPLCLRHFEKLRVETA
jgi:hypothetical protein